MTRLLLILVLALLAAPAVSLADTLTVNWAGGADYTTIGEAVTAARTGDTVLVAPGTYSGENNRNMVVSYDMTIMSEGGRRSVTIDAGGQARVFWFSDWCVNPVLSGFTIQNGDGGLSYGGGIVCYDSSPIISDCDIVACTATTHGGGLYCHPSAAPTLIDVTFTSCQADIGAGMAAFGATPSLTRVRFGGNVAVSRGGGLYCESAPGMVEITDCVFYGNQVVNMGTGGGGLFLYSSQANITGTTFAYNKGHLGSCIKLYGGSSPTIENCILAFGRIGCPIHRFDENESPTISRCVVYGNEAGDDLVGVFFDILYEDPRFCGMPTGDLTLCSNSSALPANNAWGVLMGAHGSGCGDCDSPVEGTTWGNIKSLYR